MPIISASAAKDQYDVVIVGSGAGGGQAAYTLTLAGFKCVMLEAGRSYDVVNETPMFNTNAQAPLMGTGTPDKYFGFYDATVGGGWTVPGEPYTTVQARPEEEFKWWRPRMMGGRTNHWGRISLRNGPYDLKPRSRDGLGFDWPITYDDIEPYYTKVEMLIGVYGTNEGLENTPNSPPGVLLPAPKGRAAELLTQKHGRAMGIPICSIHRAVLTTHLDFKNIPAKLHPGDPWAQKICREGMANRSACFWATSCGRGCNVGANYQSTTVHLPPALATGNLDIIPMAHAREVSIGKDGKATGIVFIDKTTGKETRVNGKVVILAAGACESVRILLNSKTKSFPQGVGNSSGKLGKYIMDSVGARLSGHIPALEDLPPHNEDGAGGDHFYSPWWHYKEQKAGKLDFARGYHIELGGSGGMPGGGNPVPDDLSKGNYGTRLKEDARRYFRAFIYFAARGEMIPNENCYVDIDPAAKDQFGVPVLRFHWKWSDHEVNQAAHAEKTFKELIEAMGGTVRGSTHADKHQAVENPGSIIHEVGGAIIGDDPKTSVCDSFNRLWDVKNLVLCDGAPFASNADKNPTLTIMALSWRACDHLIGEMKKGNL
ncbi:MAG TPA: GMC family oxidoreductase [Tepidisphaeraceae bacterium]|jgi:choline dehydrogenase-like flavoprotein|nr:GMC family oxidoreductase [Tepidisphaeraceae bacterium]